MRRQKIAEVPEPRAQWLRHFLHASEEPAVRQGAVMGLIVTHEGTPEEFRKLLDDDDDGVRVLAAYALAAHFGDEGGLGALVAFLDSTEDLILSKATIGFARAATAGRWNEEAQQRVRQGTKKLIRLLDAANPPSWQEWAAVALQSISQTKLLPESATGDPPFRYQPLILEEAREKARAWARDSGLLEEDGAIDEFASEDVN